VLGAGARGRLIDVLSATTLDRLIAEHGGGARRRLFPPEVTLGLFVEQAMSTDKACQDVVGRYRSERERHGLAVNGLGTGAYCKARQKLPLALLESCVAEVADVAGRCVPASARWRGREVRLVDGTCFSMPDTEALQADFPQPSSQAPGVGFPQLMMVGLMSLGSACVTNWTLSATQGEGNGESSQLWRLLDRLGPGDVLLADRVYATYFILAALLLRGVDFVMREHVGRKSPPVTAHAPDKGDRVLQWSRPVRPAWMPEAIYATIPETIAVRQVRDGGRFIVTSLMDPADVPADEVAWLYRQRWNIELDFRSIKTVMQMDVLRCKSPDMVRKEVAAHLLAYNLIRAVMAEAGAPEGLLPRQLGFTAAQRATAIYRCNIRTGTTAEHLRAARFLLLQQIVYWRIPVRPDRSEPRAVKRRPKTRVLLKEPRHHARKRNRRHRDVQTAAGA
jgi:hypothetical protein